jgi:protein phosphatase
MGTTLTVLWLQPAAAVIASVGDSRAYRLRNGSAEQLTKDDTWLTTVLGAEGAREAAARAHPMRHVLTSVIGSRDISAPELQVVPVEPGDVFVLTTDGLHNVLDEPMLARLAADGPAAAGARRLVESAIAHKTTDNITAVVVRT